MKMLQNQNMCEVEQKAHSNKSYVNAKLDYLKGGNRLDGERSKTSG